MMWANKFICTWIVLLAMATGAWAQTPFSLTNIGQPTENRDARMVGRGGWGMAVRDSLNPGFTNLASLSALKHVAIRFTAAGENGNHADAGSERTTHRTQIPEIRVGLPIIKDKLAFTTGMQVMRTFEFRTFEINTWYAFDDTLNGNKKFLREGTLWRVPLGLSWAPMKNVSLGASVSRVQGSLREEFFTYFEEPHDSSGNPLYLNNGLSQEDVFSGAMSTFAIQLGDGSGPSFGASYSPSYDLEIDRQMSVGGLVARSSDNWDVKMPEKWQVGFQLPIAGRWRAGGDYGFQPFSKFSGYDAWGDDMVDEYTVGFGLERVMGFARHGGSNNRPLRLGVQYKRWGYLAGGEEISEKTISIGTGFPFRKKMGMMDVAFSYSRLGDEAKNRMESNIFRMTVSVAGLERWW